MEIKNKKFREKMKKEGFESIHLEKNTKEGYFYIWTDDDSPYEKIISDLYSPSILIYSFNRFTIDQWIEEIKNILKGEN